MAAKINTRLLLIVVLATGAALALLGGVYVLKIRGDATRSFRKGQAAFDKGDFKTAYDQFGRALAKDPGNAQYLSCVEQSLLKLVPKNSTEAAERFSGYLAILGHGSVHNPTDAQAHLRLINELFAVARRTNDRSSWETLIAAADNMKLRVHEDDPQRPLASVYKAIGVGHLAGAKSDDDVQQALQDLDTAALALANNPAGRDLALATQIMLRLAIIDKMSVSGVSQTTIDAQRQAVNTTAARAIETAPQGRETALAYLTYLLVNRFGDNTGGLPSTTPGKSGSTSGVSDEDLRAAADHLVSTITFSSDKPAATQPGAPDAAITAADNTAGFITEVVAALQSVPESSGSSVGSRELAIRVLRDANRADPRAYDLQLILARLIADRDQGDESERMVRAILDAPQLPVSFVSRMQYAVRPQAASLLGDIELRRLDGTVDASRAAQMKKIKDARDLLASLSSDPANDPLLIRADAKIAYSEQHFVDASAKFEQLVRLTNERDPETLAFAAFSLEQIGQIGLAHERISAALNINPGVVSWILAKANMELRMGHPLDAASTIQPIPDTALTDPRTQQIVSAVRRAASAPSTTPTSSDPVQSAILTAQEALDKNEVDNARAALLAALGDHPEDIQILQVLAQVEIRAGSREIAAKYVEQGLRINPSDQLLNQLSAGLRYEDPIQATSEFLKATVSDDTRRLSNMIVAMSNLAMQRRDAASRLARAGDSEQAKSATDLAERAMAQAATSADELEKLDPINQQLVEFRFTQALDSKDWAKAAELTTIARQNNLDFADGLLFQGRMDLAKGNARDAILALESATDKLGFSSYAWRLLAMAYQNSGNFGQAERAYEQAYRCNPNDINGAQAYLALLIRRGDKTRALQIVRSIHTLAPNDVNLREARLSLEAEVGDPALALRERSELYATTPSDRANAAALARLLVTLDPSRETILDEHGNPKYNQQRWISLSGVEQGEIRTETRDAWAATADKIITELGKENPDDLRVAVLRATMLRERGDVTAGETVLNDFIAKHDKASQTEEMYIELGRYQANASHFNDAIASLRNAVALNGPQQRAAEVSLGLLFMQLRQYDEALKVLESAKAKQDDPTLRLQIIECLVNLGRLDDAEKDLAEVASGSGGSVVTLLQAQIARTRGDQLVAKGDISGAAKPYGEQRDLLAKAEQQDPTNPLPRILLAQSLIDEYNRVQNRALLDDAMVALDRADRIRPGSPEVSALRVAIQKELGDRTSAIAELQRSLAANPDNIAARRDLIQLMLDSGDQRGAMATVDEAIRLNPTLAVWYEYRGDLLRQSRGAVADIVAAYSSAYDRNPSSAMLLKLTDAMLNKSPPDCRGVVTKLAARDEDLKSEPAVREAYARALACDGKRDQAIEQLRLAYARRSELLKSGQMPPADIVNWFNVLTLVYPGEQAAEADKLVMDLTESKPSVHEISALATYWVRSSPSGLSRALELQRQAVALCPPEDSDLRAHLNSDLGDMLILSGDKQGAAEAYEIVIRLRPADVNALNNLTYLKAEELNDLAGAAALLDRLAAAGAKNANAMDTVGWVYFKNGDMDKAKQYLNQSLAIRPNPDAYIHLAAAQAKSGDVAAAAQSLNAAEKLSPSPDAQKLIKSLRDEIGKSGS